MRYSKLLSKTRGSLCLSAIVIYLELVLLSSLLPPVMVQLEPELLESSQELHMQLMPDGMEMIDCLVNTSTYPLMRLYSRCIWCILKKDHSYALTFAKARHRYQLVRYRSRM
jgi:hypothetical protein